MTEQCSHTGDCLIAFLNEPVNYTDGVNVRVACKKCGQNGTCWLRKGVVQQ